MEKYRTRDLVQASTLTVHKFPVTSLEIAYEGKKNHPVGYFLFDETPELKQFLVEFRSLKSLVEPTAYNAAFRALKTWVTEATN